MSPVAAGLDGLLALLLVAALVLGAKLNGRLKTLRDGQAGFAAAVLELNQAAARAEAGLNALRAAQGEAHDDLLTRIETARGLVGRLDRASLEAERAASAADRSPTPPAPPQHKPAAAGSALAAIAALAEGRARPGAQPALDTRSEPLLDRSPDPTAARPAAPPPQRRPPRSAFDDDLFEAKGVASAPDPLDLGPLRASPAPARPPRPAFAAWKTDR